MPENGTSGFQLRDVEPRLLEGQPLNHKGPRRNHNTGSRRPPHQKLTALGRQHDPWEHNDCTNIGFRLSGREFRCGTVLVATTPGGFARITSIGRSWVKGPALAGAPAHLARTATKPI